MECGTPILLRLKNIVLDPTQVSEVQQHKSVPNLDIRPLVRVGFKDMVVDAFSVEESVDMSIKLGLVIEFKGGLNFICLKENCLWMLRG